MTKQERTLVRFKCDECGKLSEEAEQPINLDYGGGWIYLYNMDFKITKETHIQIKDKHFCSKDCLIKFLTKKLQ